MTFLRRRLGEGTLLAALALVGSLVPVVLGTWAEFPARLDPGQGEVVIA